jgi:hypothetical protein
MRAILATIRLSLPAGRIERTQTSADFERFCEDTDSPASRHLAVALRLFFIVALMTPVLM